jgi:hypothetical protein
VEGTITTIANLKALYDASQPNPIQITEDLVFVAIVTSDDSEGNIFKVLYLQDETAGIAMSVDATDMNNEYSPGTKVWVRCQNLYLGEFGGSGLIQLGGGLDADDPLSVDRIPETLVGEHLIAGSCGHPVDTLEIDISAIDIRQHQSMVVKFSAVEFPSSDVGGTYAMPGGGSGQNRTVQDCNSNTIVMRNSDFASFAGELLPGGNGTMVGILGVFNDPQILINDTELINMIGTRCDGSGGNDLLIVTENFESILSGPAIDLPGWINVAEQGTMLWEGDDFFDNQFARGSAFLTGEPNNVIWLVTPAIDFDSYINEKLTFNTLKGFDNGATLACFVSTDFDGGNSPWNFTWTNLSFAPPEDATTGNWGPWTESGAIDLSGETGSGYVAWKYIGGDIGTNLTTTIQVDDIRITGEE